MKNNQLVIIDGNYLLVKSCYKGYTMKTSSDDYTGGLHIMLSSLFNYKDKGFPIVVFDGGHSQRRKDVYPNYKLKTNKIILRIEEINDCGLYGYKSKDEFLRDYEIQETINFAFKTAEKFLSKLGIPVIKIKGREADDVIYNLCGILKKKYSNLLVISEDDDYMQMLGLTNIYKPLKDKTYTEDDYIQEYGFPPQYYHVCLKSLVGDPSDNIKGIKGIGEVRGKKIIKSYFDETIGGLEFVNSTTGIDFTSWIISNKDKDKRIKDCYYSLCVIERNLELIDIRKENDEQFLDEIKNHLNIAIQNRPNIEWVKSFILNYELST